jgi:cobalt-precorrin 5A hydrolase/precorrin-3B C17-methyltransferase
MAAARAGAPLGHDFCAVSLSDLLTPWPVIEQRLEAAAAGDFVTALYNPVSQARREGFQRARAIFAAKRPASTPCIVARQLGRPDERVTVTTLAELGAAEIDMLTLVIVGSAKSRAWRTAYGREQVFTPRGYGDA